MSEHSYVKCPCQHCGDSIEFPTHGIGHAIHCPHCGQKTTLSAPVTDAIADPPAIEIESTPASEPLQSGDLPTLPTAASTPPGAEDRLPQAVPRSRRVWAILAIVALAAGGVLVALRGPWARSGSADGPEVVPAEGSPTSVAADPGARPTNGPPGAANAPKSIEDLKVGGITLEKAKGSSLVYAVGQMRNESNHQRYGVKLELELTDARGNKVGVAKDYRSVLEPRQEWRFRALVLDSKAVAAKVSAIHEEE